MTREQSAKPAFDVRSDDLPVADLRNLGPRSAGWLACVGIETLGDLRRIGAVVAYRLVDEHGFAPSVNLLYALEAALRDVYWVSLDRDDRETLKREVAR